jgi:structural maintenance of chromosome 2
MHILEVIIDGFKSYATRTVVSGFDPAFNAITGLNGSGKSNILDAICFVLGISNLSQVRAANLQDLVYKQGQAGVTKASVTIVFDNSEIKSSPVGYEGEKRLCVTREVVVGGRNRYLINGKGAQASSVANLFQSVQLNVNNPHFLIMQGRITKVLNMKPPEILSMVEEAAGTRMFESKKQAALKTLDKKQAKVDEIDRVLAADITPTLERLREEKSHYLRWSANAAEVSRLERFCVAAEYDEAEKNAQVAGEGIVAASLRSRRWRLTLYHYTGAAKAEREAQALEQEASDKADEAEAKRAQEQKCRAKDGAAGLASQRRKELKKAVDDASTEVARLEAAQKGAQTAFDADDSRLKGEADAAADNERVESAKKEEVAVCEEAVAKCTQEKDEADQAFNEAETVHKEALAGKGATDTKSVSEQLAAHKDAQRTARATLKKCDAKQSALEKRREQAAELAAKYASSAKGLKKAFSACEAKVDACQSAVDEHAATSPGDADALQRQAKELSQKARECSQRAQRTEAQLKARLKFDYEHPGKGFDAEKVRGVLASLVTPCDGKYAAALEVVAGGRLYQVVVDDEKTGKALLERGQLRRRVTLIPLNKVRAGRLDEKRCSRASSVAKKAGGSARIALEFVGHEEHVKNAVEYAFGGALVCDSMDV